MATKTLMEPKMTPTDLDAHKQELATLRAQQADRREEMIRCCNPGYAAAREYEKPCYEWTVTAEWYGAGDDGPGVFGPTTMKVKAQNEADAWSMFCDRIGQWPSPRDTKRTIKRGKQISADDVVAAAISGTEMGQELPRYTVTPKKKSR